MFWQFSIGALKAILDFNPRSSAVTPRFWANPCGAGSGVTVFNYDDDDDDDDDDDGGVWQLDTGFYFVGRLTVRLAKEL